MLIRLKKCFTLVEVLVALAVSSIAITAAYSSYQLVADQYAKNTDLSDMHATGRSIMAIIKRDIRMAGFEYRDDNGVKVNGGIPNPLVIKDSGNACCDSAEITYDYYDEYSKKLERRKISYYTKPYSNNKGNRNRLYKKVDILDKSNSVIRAGSEQPMADFIEDFQVIGIQDNLRTFTNGNGPQKVDVWDPVQGKKIETITVSGLDRNYGYVTGLAFDSSTNTLFVGSYWQGSGIWKIDLNTGQQVKIPSSINRVDALAFNKNDKLLYVGHAQSNEGISAIDTNSGNIIFNMKSPHGPGTNVAGQTAMSFDTNGYLWVGYASHYGFAKLDVTNRKLYRMVENYSFPSSELALASDVKGYMYAGGGSEVGLTAIKPDGNIVVSKRLKSQLAGNGINTRPVKAAAVGSVSYGDNQLIDLSFILRTKNQHSSQNKQFSKKTYWPGNFLMTKNDRYEREFFHSSVVARNMAL